jgi:hypothetical protein
MTVNRGDKTEQLGSLALVAGSNWPAAPANSVAVAAPGGSDVTQCYFFYTSSTAQREPPDFSTVVTTGC